MAGSRKAAARFYFHGSAEGVETDALGGHWFSAGDDVPGEVASQVGSHLFEGEKEPAALPTEPDAPQPRPRVPRQRKHTDE